MIFSSSIRTANMTLLYLQRRFLINAKLKVWTAPTLRSIKPEDKKAYYACAGGTGAIELA